VKRKDLYKQQLESQFNPFAMVIISGKQEMLGNEGQGACSVEPHVTSAASDLWFNIFYISVNQSTVTLSRR
jgi:hypothetical protein